MKCKECQARDKQLNDAIRRVVLDGGIITAPDGFTYPTFQKKLIRFARSMNVEIVTRVVSKADRSIRVRRFYE